MIQLAPSRSTKAVLISIAVHAVVVVAIAWSATGKSGESHELGFAGDAPPSNSGGVGGLSGVATERPAPKLGRSISAAEARDYIGQYSIVTPRRPKVEMLISHVNDDIDHWSLLVHEGNQYPYKLIPAARDSFVHQMVHARRFVFVRGDSGVVAVDLNYRGVIRRGVKVGVR